MGGRTEFLDLHFDDLDMAAMLDALRARRADAPFVYVVTPNVDHIVRLSKEGQGSPLRRAYADAGWCLCDSRILARLAAWRGVRLPVVPGSDLTARLIHDTLEPGDRLCLIGGGEEDIAALAALRPDIVIVQHIPPLGLDNNAAARAAAARFAAEASARFTLLAVGSPQQEQVAAEMCAMSNAAGTALCVGASLDFVTGRQHRAPRWMQRASLEWLHRLARNPARLWRRYLVEGPCIFALAWRWKHR